MTLKSSSDRSFGLVFAALFAGVAVYRAQPWLFAVGGFFLLAALSFPRLLHPLNVAWDRFGRLLHRLFSPLILTAVFYAVITPIALVARLCGQRFLSLKFDRTQKSYWLEKSGDVNMKEQF